MSVHEQVKAITLQIYIKIEAIKTNQQDIKTRQNTVHQLREEIKQLKEKRRQIMFSTLPREKQ